MPILKVSFLEPYKFSLLQFLGRHPILWSLSYGLRPSYKNNKVRRYTDIVINGFPRTGNTYTTLAFQQAQHNRVNISHHGHVIAQFIQGMKYDIPVLVLIRNPLDTVTSHVVRHPTISISHSLLCYIRFYSEIAGMLNYVVVADFAEITNDFNSVINRINKRFDTDFDLLSNQKQTQKEVFSKIYSIYKKKQYGNPFMIAMPTEIKEQLKNKIKPNVIQNFYFKRAQRVYKSIMERRQH
jgi:hypothetical protein